MNLAVGGVSADYGHSGFSGGSMNIKASKKHNSFGLPNDHNSRDIERGVPNSRYGPGGTSGGVRGASGTSASGSGEMHHA